MLAALVPAGTLAGSEFPPPRLPTVFGTSGLEAALAEIRGRPGEVASRRLGSAATLHPGDRSVAVAALRERLKALGENAPSAVADPTRFDEELAEAVRSFQRRRGLEPDGIVGAATRAELELSSPALAERIERSLASRRGLPADLGSRFLLLNLSAFELTAFEARTARLTLRVVIGEPAKPTPTLRSRVDGVVVHPVWNVPPPIARDEIAPRVIRDPDYIRRLGFEIYSGESESSRVDPTTIDWRSFARGETGLVLRQRPGPLNALGAVSMQFPNPDNICLHDTPERTLFARARRALSHGCIRVEHAVELARWLLAPQPAPVQDAFERALAGSKSVHLLLPGPVPLYIVDWPAWIAPDGTLEVRPEVYP